MSGNDRHSAVTIRTEDHADLDAIRKVHVESFPTHLEAQLVDELRDSGRLRISLVAEEEGKVVGHVAFSPVASRTQPTAPDWVRWLFDLHFANGASPRSSFATVSRVATPCNSDS
jgi:hypothetical protein